MIPDALEYRRKDSENSVFLPDPFQLKALVQEMQEMLLDNHTNEVIQDRNFGYSDNGKQRPLGYEVIRDINFNVAPSAYRRNRLRHKLIRMQKEFQFTRKYLKKYQSLTPREIEIVKLLATGMNNPAIAQKLFISRYTVEQHRKHINSKLELPSLIYLFRYAYAFDLI